MPWREPGGPEVQSGVRSPEAVPEKVLHLPSGGRGGLKGPAHPLLRMPGGGVRRDGRQQAWAPAASSSSSKKRPV